MTSGWLFIMNCVLKSFRYYTLGWRDSKNCHVLEGILLRCSMSNLFRERHIIKRMFLDLQRKMKITKALKERLVTYSNDKLLQDYEQNQRMIMQSAQIQMLVFQTARYTRCIRLDLLPQRNMYKNSSRVATCDEVDPRMAQPFSSLKKAGKPVRDIFWSPRAHSDYEAQ